VRPAWVTLALFLALPAPAALAADPLWSVRASASGTYSLDYGDDGDAIDGQGSGSWRWAMKALADGPKLDTSVAVFRMSAEETSDVVAGGTPSCRPAPAFQLGWVRDWRVGLFLSTSGGFQVSHPFFDRLDGCHVGAHGMTLYDGASPADTPVPRRAFRPRSTRRFERTWTQEISLPPGHESGTPHGFLANGTLTIRARRISKRGAAVLRARLRRVPRTPPSS
jgi:hypothetical protein